MTRGIQANLAPSLAGFAAGKDQIGKQTAAVPLASAPVITASACMVMLIDRFGFAARELEVCSSAFATRFM